ncbi:hypothetical protein [Rhodovibrio sodomensis]|nr:hypothetical protein [Rhodovibrio sodomensis]
MTATLGETYASRDGQTTGAAAGQTAPYAGARRSRSVRRVRRDLTTGLAQTAGSHRVAAAMVGLLAGVALAGACVQAVAG